MSVQAYVVDMERTVTGMHDAEAAADIHPDTGNEYNATTCTKDGPPEEGITIEPVGERPECCVLCGYDMVIKYGRVYRLPVSSSSAESVWSQRYKCNGCGCTFTYRKGFERMRKPERSIMRALNDYFKGHMFAAIADTLKNAGVSMNPSSIYGWIIKYSAMLYAYMQILPIKTGERFSADGLFVSVRGEQRYLFMINDVETRLCLAHEMAYHKDGHNATGLLQAAKKIADKTPCKLVTDALRSYEETCRNVCIQQPRG